MKAVEGSWGDCSNIGGSEDRYRISRMMFWLIYEPGLGGERDAEDRSWNLGWKSSTKVRNSIVQRIQPMAIFR